LAGRERNVSNEPTAQDAIRAYFAALANYYGVEPDTVDWPIVDNVKESAPGSFTIRAGTDVIIVMYHKAMDLWIVRLEDGAIIRVRKKRQEGSSPFVVE
jgi:hypothetical protein